MTLAYDVNQLPLESFRVEHKFQAQDIRVEAFKNKTKIMSGFRLKWYLQDRNGSSNSYMTKGKTGNEKKQPQNIRSLI